MGQTIEKYVYTDEEGDKSRINYIHNSCMCTMSCEDDTLEVWEDMCEELDSPYRTDINANDPLAYFIRDMLDQHCERLEE